MAWSRPWVLVRLLLPFALMGCSDDGDPQNAGESGTEGGDAAGGTAEGPSITTTQSTSITNGDDDGEAEDGVGTTGPSVTADDDGTTGDSASFDDTGVATDGTDGGTGTGSDGPAGTDDRASTGESDGSDGTSSGGDGPIGAECTEDADCESGVCWDYSDYDPFCFGTVCSSECEEHEDCVEVASDAGSLYPENAQCGEDGRCDLMGAGLGAFACAGS